MAYPMTPGENDFGRLIARTGLTTASPFQAAIFNHVDTNLALIQQGGPVNLVVQAVAGSGKTTTIVSAAKLIPQTMTALFLAFNTDIARELGNKLPDGVESRTLNSLGLKIIGKYIKGLTGTWPEMDASKVWKIIRNLYSRHEVDNHGVDVNWLVGMCKSLGIVPSSVADDLELVSLNGRDDSDESFEGILEHFDHHIDFEYRRTVFRMTREVLSHSCQDLSVLDFNDQKYLPVVLRPSSRPLNTFPFQVVMVDEVQDVNDVDIALIDMVTTRVQKQAQRRYGMSMVIGVGDENQAVYGFRGADTQAVSKFRAHFDAIDLPLSITYRCAAAIVRCAQEIYPTIQAAPNAIEGEVNRAVGEFDHTLFSPGDDMIVCRNNAPTIELAYKLIARRVPVFVAGRDIGKNLLAVVERIEADTTVELVEGLETWYEKQYTVIVRKDPDDEGAIERLNDRRDTIMVFVNSNTDGRAATVVQDIKDLFHTEAKGNEDNYNKRASQGKVVLSSMHKAKGLEADRVFILDYGLMYRFAKPGSWQYTQEKNLDYVARTRPKKYLGFIGSDDWKKAA